MFLEALGELTASATRAIPYLRGIMATKEKLSHNEILRRYKAAGGELRRKAGLDVLNRLDAIQSTKKYISSVNLSKHLDKLRIPFASGETLRDYSFTVRVTGVHPDTGLKIERHIQVSSSVLLTKQQAIDVARSYKVKGKDSPNLLGEKWGVVEVVKSRTWSP